MRKSILCSSFAVRAVVVPALLLICPLLASPPLCAAEGAPDAAGIMETIPAQEQLNREIAERVTARAMFAAEIGPKIAAFTRGNEQAFRRSSHGSAENLIHNFWLLRSRPGLQKEWLEKFTAAGADKMEREKRRVSEEFFSFMREIGELSRCMVDKSENQESEKRRATLYRLFDNRKDRTAYERAKLFYRLEETKSREEMFRRAIAVRELVGTDLRDICGTGRHLPVLAKLAERPDDLRLAVELIKDDSMAEAQTGALLGKLVTSPEAGRKAIKDRENLKALLDRYVFAVSEEGCEDIIRLPLAAVMPEALEAVRKPGTIPLGKDRTTVLAKGLTLTRRERMLPDGSAPYRGKGAPGLSFLRPGERLYMVRERREGTSVFGGTPLDALAFFGPSVLEYGEATEGALLRHLEGNPNGREWERPYFIAAVCGPAELAAHLASLSVMHSKREKSLYGPFEEFTWNREDSCSPLGKRIEPIPGDTPGETLRLANIADADLFPALAKHADDKGLARLLGPVRGVWAQDRPGGDTPWAELRFAPPGKEEPRPGVLGSSPLLALHDDVLREIVAAKDALIIQLWAGYFLRKECGNDTAACAGLRPGAVERVEEIFTGLRAKGFVSPRDKGAVLYFTEYAAKDPGRLTFMRAVIDDTRQSSAKRARAVRAAGENR